MNQISTLRKAYVSPDIHKIHIDNEISLSMESYVDPPLAPDEEEVMLLTPDSFNNDPFKSQNA